MGCAAKSRYKFDHRSPLLYNEIAVLEDCFYRKKEKQSGTVKYSIE